MAPWMTFADEFNKYHDDYQQETKDLIINIQDDVKDGMNFCTTAANNAYQWSGCVVPAIEAYNILFNKTGEDLASAQKTLLLDVLEDGLQVLEDTLPALANCSSFFWNAADKLPLLSSRIENEFGVFGNYHLRQLDKLESAVDTNATLSRHYIATYGPLFRLAKRKFDAELRTEMESIKESYEIFKEKLINATVHIGQTKSALKAQIEIVEDLRFETKYSDIFANLDPRPNEQITESVNDLIKNCNILHQKYIK